MSGNRKTTLPWVKTLIDGKGGGLMASKVSIYHNASSYRAVAVTEDGRLTMFSETTRADKTDPFEYWFSLAESMGVSTLVKQHKWLEDDEMEAPGFASAIQFMGVLSEEKRGSLEFEMAHTLVNSIHMDGDEARKEAEKACRTAIREFVTLLDTEAVRFAGDNEWFAKHGRRCWRGIDTRFVPNAPLRKVAERYPQHVDMLRSYWTLNEEKFRQQFDAGASPEAILSTSLKSMEANYTRASKRIHISDRLLKSAASRPPTLPPDWVPAEKQMPATAAVEMLARLPQDWIPSNETEWDALCQLSTIFEHARKHYRNGDEARVFNSKGRWSEFLTRIETAIDASDENDINNALNDVSDMVNAFRNEIMVPAWAKIEYAETRREWFENCGPDSIFCPTQRDVAAILFGEKSLPGILESSEKWHARRHRITADIVAISPDLPTGSRWKPGLSNAVIDGIEFVVLTNKDQLGEEGKLGGNHDGTTGLDHCVGGYAQACLSGAKRIVSMRIPGDRGFKRLSTAEIKIDGGKFEIVQHRGLKNAAPDQTCVTALEKYVEMHKKGDLEVKWGELVALRDGTDSLATAGYDFREEGAFQRALAAWAPTLPRIMRDWTEQDFVSHAKQEMGMEDDKVLERKP